LIRFSQWLSIETVVVKVINIPTLLNKTVKSQACLSLSFFNFFSFFGG
jgi:hypothetical protein